MAINLNEMAKTIAVAEGGNREVDITQIKQVMRIFLVELGKHSDQEVSALLNKYRAEL